MGADGAGDTPGEDSKLTGIDEARRRIAEAARTGATVLDLGGLGLTEVPKEIAALTSLTSLNLRNNRIGAEGARALAALTHLTLLNLGGNQIGAEGAHAIASLTGLTSLDLGYNQIGDDGARAIAALTGLTSLNLSNNRIGNDGARAIAALTALTSLDLGHNEIRDGGTRAFVALSHLTSLNLRGNQIGPIGAHAIATLSGLTLLNLGGNRIGDYGVRALAALTGLTSLHLGDNGIGDDGGTRAIAALTGLTWLDLRSNRIGAEGARALLDPWADSSMGQLDRLDISHNDIGDLGVPAEGIESGDAQAILAAYRAFRQAERQGSLKPLNEAKMLVIGNEAVGKTSLIRYLVHGQARNPDEEKTKGTAIHEKIEIQDWSPHAADIKLNVWDFGGQEIMHGTHRYFLTRRSLYLLVLEDRREDDRAIYNWLKIIKNRGGDAPVIVVINKSDKGRAALRLDEEGLKREHPEIVKFLRTSCDSDKWAEDSIERLRKAIARCLAKHKGLRQIRDSCPDSWLWVKQQIADLARANHVLRIAEFERLCLNAADKFPDAATLRDEATQRALLRLLHDLGVLIAHGLSADDLSVDPTVALLDPNWLTGAIYTVLNHPDLVHQNGIFERAQLSAWLDPAIFPAARYKFILDMMRDEDIGLAFELPNSKGERFLVPEGLPKNSPDYSTWPKDSLRFRFRYEFLPPGLIPRFIVAAHRNLTKKETPWRNGGVFQYSGSCVLVEGDADKKVIDIAVTKDGTDPRATLHVMLNYFDHVHRLNPEALPQRLVPMPDDPEVEEQYDYLLRLAKEEGADYRHRPTGSKHSYRVGDLLTVVGPDHFNEMPDIADMRINSGSGNINVTVDPSDTMNWTLIAVGSGLAAVAAVVIIALLPPAWQLPVGGLSALFVGVTAFVFFRNPAWFYKRMIGVAMAAGLFWSAFGAFLEIKVGPTAVVTWKSQVDPVIYVFVVVAVLVCAWADVRLQQQAAKTGRA